MTQPQSANQRPLRIVFLGLTISSSWGNGHATTYRGLLRELGRAGHEVWFLERDTPWYAEHRDCPQPDGCALLLYQSLRELEQSATQLVRNADAVIVGSYVPQGIEVAHWTLRIAQGVVAFYDIDTPVTLAKLARGDEEYLRPGLIPRFDLYLSFTGGPLLDKLEIEHGARRALPLYCAVDVERYRPSGTAQLPYRWDLGYLGTYSDDRQPMLDRLLVECARNLPERRFVIAGPRYPNLPWPANLTRIEHLAPTDHPAFYASQRFTLNVTRSDMVAAGHSPSVRLFEAAACGIPIISDIWKGIETFFEPDHEILLARNTDQVQCYLEELSDEQRQRIGTQARERVLREHTAAQRAATLVSYLGEALGTARVPVPEDAQG